ncbi:MAG TPA: hypothetical protein VGG33_27350 [Polyangia bacterium]
MNDATDLTVTTETMPLTRMGKLRANLRNILSEVKGSTTIEKIIIIAVFCFAIVSGVQALATSTEGVLTAQGVQVAKFGVPGK